MVVMTKFCPVYLDCGYFCPPTIVSRLSRSRTAGGGGDCAGNWGCKRHPGSHTRILKSWPQMTGYHIYPHPRIDWPIREILRKASISDKIERTSCTSIWPGTSC